MAGRAVFISVAEYENQEFRSYPAIHNSAAELGGLFGASERWDECVRVVDPHEPKGLLDEILPVFQRCAPQDVLLIYFCGHGLQLRGGAGMHLALSGSDSGNLASLLDLQHLYNALQNDCAANTKMLILDCCDSGDAPPIRAVRHGPAEQEPRTFVLSAVSSGNQLAAAGRSAADEGYTAFSGALIDILRDGISGAESPLLVGTVYRQLLERLSSARHPAPRLQADGEQSLPLLENGGLGGSVARERLAGANAAELAAIWAGSAPGEPVPAQVVKNHVRRMLASAENAQEIAHELHRQDARPSNLLRDFEAVVLAKPLELSGRTARLLAGGGCPECGEVARRLLAAAIERPDVEQIAVSYLELGEPCPELENDFVQRVPPQTFTAVLESLRRQRAGDNLAGSAVDRLIALFATVRDCADLQALLDRLHSPTWEWSVQAVLENVVQRRSPETVAAFAQQLSSSARDDAESVNALVVRNWLPQDVAAYIAAFDSTAESAMNYMLSIAVENRSSPNWLLRLVRTLRACGMADGPSAIIGAALHYGVAAEQVGELLDGLTDCGAEQCGKIETQLRERLLAAPMRPAEMVPLLRREHGPGRPQNQVTRVAAKRELHSVIELYKFAARTDTRLAWRLARAVAEHRPSGRQLAEFISSCDIEVELVRDVLTTISQRQDAAEIIGCLLWLSERPVQMTENSVALPDLIAELAPPAALPEARNYVYDAGKVLDAVIREVLRRAEGLQPQTVAALLADLPQSGRRQLGEVRKVVGDLIGRYFPVDGSPVDVDELAGLVAAVARNELIARQVADDISDQSRRKVSSPNDAALNRRYKAALLAFGAGEVAEEFGKRTDT